MNFEKCHNISWVWLYWIWFKWNYFYAIYISNMWWKNIQGVANRGASVRVGRETEKDGKGKFLWNPFSSVFFNGLIKFQIFLFFEQMLQVTSRIEGQLQTWILTSSLPWSLKQPFCGSPREKQSAGVLAAAAAAMAAAGVALSVRLCFSVSPFDMLFFWVDGFYLFLCALCADCVQLMLGNDQTGILLLFFFRKKASFVQINLFL